MCTSAHGIIDFLMFVMAQCIIYSFIQVAFPLRLSLTAKSQQWSVRNMTLRTHHVKVQTAYDGKHAKALQKRTALHRGEMTQMALSS